MNSGKFLEKERLFNKELRDLKSAPVEMVDDFQNPVSKDIPREKITSPVQNIKSGAEFLADQNMRVPAKEAGDVLDYKDLRKQFAAKAKALSGLAGKKVLGALPLVGGVANALMSGDASAAVPGLDQESLGPAAGSIDDRLERGTLTEEDRILLRQQALQNMRR